MEKTDCIVIGAGVVGLAVARTFALAGHEVIILEAENISPFFILFFATIDFLTNFLFFSSDLLGFFK